MKIKQIIIGVLSAIIVLLGGNYAVENLGGGKQEIAVFQCQTATTTPTFLTTSTASSSCIMNISDYDSQAENWMLKASTTATVLHRCRYVSNENLAADRNWFLLADGCNAWTPANASASSTYQNINTTNIKGKYMKIEYKLTGDAGAVYLETTGFEGF